MAQYRYNGQVLVKNSRREDFEYACIENRDGKIVKIQISSTYDGAGAEKRRMISRCRENIENYKRAIRAVENGRDYATFNHGRYHERIDVEWYKKVSYISDEKKAMLPIDYYQMRIEECHKNIEWYEENWIIVKVEKV